MGPQVKVSRIKVVGMKTHHEDLPDVAKALEGEGVLRADVDFDRREATVQYDPSVTTAWVILGRLTSKQKYADSTMISAE